MRGRVPTRSHAHRGRLPAPFIAALASVLFAALLSPSLADAASAGQLRLVSAVPAAYTPDVNDGVVDAIAQVGDEIVLGGSFTSVSPPDDLTTKYPVTNTVAFNAKTGAIDSTGYLPAVNGPIDTIIPGPRPDEVYIGGSFTAVDGVAMRVALLDIGTGAIASTWKPSTMGGTIGKLALSNGRLFVGGTFTKVGGVAHQGLVALNPSSGKVTSYVNLSFSGHHNYGSKCYPAKMNCAKGRVGIKALAVNPAGTKLVAVGNFTDVSGFHRDQIALIDLGRSTATVDSHWATLAYTAACLAHAFDSYIRDVQFAPSGGYFVVAAAGGIGTNSDGTNASCDAAARFETNGSGTDVRPTWIDYTGEDSLWTVAVTRAAVYVGGHQRWLNNSLGHNAAGPGAIPRPGIAALSPQSGLPLSWNPGRDPRGAGSYAILATSDGLWIGSDTDYIGVGQYFRAKIAFFPLAGGEFVPADPTPALPGRVFLVGATATGAPDPDRLAYREFDGRTAGTEEQLATGIDWGSVDGAFTVDGDVIYGESDGNLYERTFDGTTFGGEVELDPFNDPTWDNVETGSGQKYQGRASTFSAEIPSITSMFFSAGRLYYTIAGAPLMHWRWFAPESGVVGADEFTLPSDLNWSNVSGAFLAGNTLYYANATNGELWSVDWHGSAISGKPMLVDASRDWASRGLFLLSNSTNPTPNPVAAFSATCGHSATCAFDATPWIDPDGGVVRYRWDFGRGAAVLSSASTTATHRFVTNGSHRVTLTVETTSGAVTSVSETVVVAAPVANVRFVAASRGAGTGKKLVVSIPRRSEVRDALVLFDSYSSTTTKVTVPRRWTLIGRTRQHSLTTAVYERVAGQHFGGRHVTVRYSRPVSSTVILAAYSHTSIHPIEAAAHLLGVTTRSHLSPVLRAVTTGSWVIGYWTQTSRRSTSWRLPRRLAQRAVVHSRGRPVDGAVLADRGEASAGTCRLGTAHTSRPGAAAAEWAIALAPALR